MLNILVQVIEYLKLYKMNKKAMAWISWILLLLFFLILSVMVYQWSIQHTEMISKQMQEYVEGNIACSDVVFDVQLDISANNDEVTNYGTITIDKLLVRYDGAQSTELEINLIPGNSQLLNMPPYTKSMEVLPMLLVGNDWVVCPEKKLVFE